MPDNRSGALSVALFTANEHLVLGNCFGVNYPRSERWIEDILDECKIPDELFRYSQRANGELAHVLHAQGGDSLPQWVGVTREGVHQAVRPVYGGRARRRVEPWSCQLIGNDWTNNAPGFSWGIGDRGNP
jgi:hypothetical protein